MTKVIVLAGTYRTVGDEIVVRDHHGTYTAIIERIGRKYFYLKRGGGTEKVRMEDNYRLEGYRCAYRLKFYTSLESAKKEQEYNEKLRKAKSVIIWRYQSEFTEEQYLAIYDILFSKDKESPATITPIDQGL